MAAFLRVKSTQAVGLSADANGLQKLDPLDAVCLSLRIDHHAGILAKDRNGSG
jgi:hypothetical protein